jgi:HAD superfamily hydrolase (TIGR01484 family)
MRYLALATDYDGTIAHHGGVDVTTLDALRRLAQSGRKLLLVTGRELPDLQKVFPELELFDQVVAENGALLYDPKTRAEQCIAEAPPPEFIAELERRGIPISVGRSIVATVQPHETAMLEAIRELGLELHVIFNKGAVMALPSGMNKGVGLKAALRGMGLSPHNVVGVGDAENDHAFLSLCGCSAATANALDMLKQRADVVLTQGWGAGVTELISKMLDDDLAQESKHITRHSVLLGRKPGTKEEDAQGEVRIPAYGSKLLVAGPSGSGKSTAVSGLLERLQQAHYQYCLIDPEGDYDGFPHSITLGNAQHAPTVSEALDMLEKFNNTVVNLLGIKLADRPHFFAQLQAQLLELQARTGRPHWLVIDEAHHMMPAVWEKAENGAPLAAGSTLLITVHPEMVAADVLAGVNGVIAVGKEPGKTLREFSKVAGVKLPSAPAAELESGEVLVWQQGDEVRRVRVEPGAAERLRHRRKYAAGDVHEKSFYFRGPEGKLSLRAQNLNIFMQMAAGVDDETWTHHLAQGHYSAWVKDAIKDPDLARHIEEIEHSGLDAQESRQRIFAAIEERYTGAA